MNMKAQKFRKARAVAPKSVPSDVTQDALRLAFRTADRKMRQRLRAALSPCEISFLGVRMWVDPRDNYTDLRLWLEGEPPETQSLSALTYMVQGRNAFVLDIGANSGAYTVPLAAVVGSGSRVIAFEPNPIMIGRLGHNLALNKLGHVARIEGCALGATPGEATLNLRARNYGEASLKPVPARRRTGQTLVPVRSILDFVGEAEGHDVSVLKLDVEGSEVEALGPLLDAGTWLPDAILMETAHARTWEVDLVAVIRGLGYDVALEADANMLFVRAEAST